MSSTFPAREQMRNGGSGGGNAADFFPSRAVWMAFQAVYSRPVRDSWERTAERTGTLAGDEDRESALRAVASVLAGWIYAESCSEVLGPCAGNSARRYTGVALLER